MLQRLRITVLYLLLSALLNGAWQDKILNRMDHVCAKFNKQFWIDKVFPNISTGPRFLPIHCVARHCDFVLQIELAIKIRVCKSVHHHTFNWINQPDAENSQVYYLSFKYSSICFGYPHAHHQELQQLQ